MLDEGQMAETPVSLGFLFHKPVYSAIVVKPGKASLHFPPLLAVLSFP